MVDTVISDAAVLASLAGNTTGDIDPQDMRNQFVTLRDRDDPSTNAGNLITKGTDNDRSLVTASGLISADEGNQISAGTDSKLLVAAGVTTFVGLTDTPEDYTSAASKLVKVNGAGDALEFVTDAASSYRETFTVSSPVATIEFIDIPTSGYIGFSIVVKDLRSSYAGGTTESASINTSSNNGTSFNNSSGDYYASSSPLSSIATFLCCTSNSTFPYGTAEIFMYGLGNSVSPTTAFVNSYITGISTTNTLANNGSIVPSMRMVVEEDTAIEFITHNGANFTSGTITITGISE